MNNKNVGNSQIKSTTTYKTPAKITEKFGISYSTLHKWRTEGKIDSIKTPGGSYRYSVQSIEKILSIKHTIDEQRKSFIYARVSSSHQAKDLERQKDDLCKSYPNYEIISDIGSGLNWKRPGFKRLLELVFQNKVECVVVAHKDRLCRFAYELLEQLLENFGTKILVHTKCVQDELGNQELAEDILAIINYFTAKHNGLRSAKNRRERKLKEETCSENDESKTIAN